MIHNREFLELQLNALLDMTVGESFTSREERRVVTREELKLILRRTVQKAIELHQEDFKLGMRKTLADARLRSLIEMKSEGLIG